MFDPLNSAPPVSVIFRKNNYRRGPLTIGEQQRICSILYGWAFSSVKTSGPAMKATGSESLRLVVNCKVRNWCIDQVL